MKVSFRFCKRVTGPVVGLLCGVWLLGASGSAWPQSSTDFSDEQALTVECAPLLAPQGAWHGLQTAKVLLQSQGMRLVPQACPFVRTGGGQLQQVLDVRVWVADSETASRFVRGPLADGEEVDMGAASLIVPRESLGDDRGTEYTVGDEVAPDVQFNRHWLAQLMLSRGWQAVAGYWWAFVPQVGLAQHPALDAHMRRVLHKSR